MPLLRMSGVRKRFGAVIALDGVDLEVEPGEVHALVGENGAGKSTLMKVLSGAHPPDEGTVTLEGGSYSPTGPVDALRRGVAMIYQELNLAPHLTVEQNVMLGREEHTWGWLRRRSMRERVLRAFELLERTEIDPERHVAELGPGERQLVEIARSLAGEARVLIMDEPTSSLSRRETERLFAVIRRLRDRGTSVIYISHFLEELKQVADRYTVLRDGRTVATGDMGSVPLEHLVEQMVGRRLEEAFPRVPHEPGAVALRVDGLMGRGLPRSASFELHRGEIFGIAGLVGAGRTELLRTLFGLAPVAGGRVVVAGREDRGRPPGARLAQRIGLLSEDRKDEGLALGLSIAENVTLSHLRSCSRFGWIDGGRRDALTQRWIDALAIRCRSPRQAVGELSGGNQQKAAIARLLHHDVDVLLLDEPTRGIDVGSKVEVYRLMGELAARGKAILFVSGYVPELLGICDRIAVMHRGVLGRARPVAEWTETSILDEAARGAAAA